uniref:Uncharacterized protein n=1 Tax=uncultured marine virus TaxID=186617 RepID=A0A0F7L390_9VIRU|nr:hypothetical protein [uncultured marine virus]
MAVALRSRGCSFRQGYLHANADLVLEGAVVDLFPYRRQLDLGQGRQTLEQLNQGCVRLQRILGLTHRSALRQPQHSVTRDIIQRESKITLDLSHPGRNLLLALLPWSQLLVDPVFGFLVHF